MREIWTETFSEDFESDLERKTVIETLNYFVNGENGFLVEVTLNEIWNNSCFWEGFLRFFFLATFSESF